MPSASPSYDDGTLSASAALAWKFYAFGMLGVFVTGILGTVIYLGCFRLRKPAVRGDVEANSTKIISYNERKLTEGNDEPVPVLTNPTPLSFSTATLVSLPPKAYIVVQCQELPHDLRSFAPSIETLPHIRQ
ncbi:hypothetical protein BD779DRAFT_1668200 [Infundibulicybe gibba]|nr:hypothetical protein BD779DRAFT_1668200 [Infundibulicybe gibba]